MTDCLFCKIIAGEIPSQKVYEDENMLAFKDIRPSAPVHILLIPKKHISSLQDLSNEDADLMGKLMLAVPKIATENGLANGFKTQINTGVGGGQEVFHLHIHIMGRPS
ncbi:MAG: histidine triad nucleotide-binding protein [Neisseriaceae bacterium]|nr:histidine triad nucleotide-binding protein [Neisseriaceae bacterium]